MRCVESAYYYQKGGVRVRTTKMRCVESAYY